MTAAMAATHLTKSFGFTKALNDLDLHVVTGEVRGFLKPNGAGKSTTIRVLLGLLRPDPGGPPCSAATLARRRESGPQSGPAHGRRGVENDIALSELTRLGCDQAQGYFISRPVPAVELDQWLGTRPAGDKDTDRARLVPEAALG